MIGDRWTLLLFRGHDAPPAQYSVSPRAVRYSVAVAGAIGLIFAGLFVWFSVDGVDRVQTWRLQAENEMLTRELESLRGQVGRLEGTLAGLTENDARLRLMAGLDPIDDEILEVGVGGPGLGTPADHPLWEIDPALGETAFAVEYDIEALERRARLLDASYAETTDSLAAHRDLLESTPSILPAPGLLSSGFSRSRMHPIHHTPLAHEGIDVSAPRGTPIFAAAKGTVVRVGWTAGYGEMVEIDHGYGYVTRYGHASKTLVRRGQVVERGEAIARVGSSGIATGAHVHYEVLVDGVPQNPMNYVWRVVP